MTRVKRSNPLNCAPSPARSAAELAQVHGGATMVEYALLSITRWPVDGDAAEPRPRSL
jgi:hypothetical protein